MKYGRPEKIEQAKRVFYLFLFSKSEEGEVRARGQNLFYWDRSTKKRIKGGNNES